MKRISTEEVVFVDTAIHANPEALIPLLLERGYREMGECFHPTWRNQRGIIFSKIASPMFWVGRSSVLGSYSIFIWIADKPQSGMVHPDNVMIGHELLSILKESAEGAIERLKEVLGEEHIRVSFESYPEEFRRSWAKKKKWLFLLTGKISIEIS